MILKWIFSAVCSSYFLAYAFAANDPVKNNGYIIKLNVQDRSAWKQFSQTMHPIKLKFGNYALFYLSEDLDQIEREGKLRILRRNPIVEYIEPNYVLTPSQAELFTETDNSNDLDKNSQSLVEDSLYSKQWGLKNTGAVEGSFGRKGKPGIDINAEGAWTITSGTKDVIVGVLDGGILFDHPDLIDNIWINETELKGIKGIDDDHNGYFDDIWGYRPEGDRFQFPTDMSGHGTHVAGIIGMSHNLFGGRGVAGKVKLMTLKVKNDSTLSYELIDMLKAIDYGVKMGATILTTSIGGHPYSKAHEDAIKYAISKGIPFVCACGNSNKNLDKMDLYPPSFVKKIPEMIVVCGLDPTGDKDYLSNYGRTVSTILAPGTNILSTSVSGNFNQRGVKDPIYQNKSGTSMAAPFVAGALSLLYSQGPRLLPAEAKARLIKSARKSSKLEKYSQAGGWLDVSRLLE